MTAEKRKYIIYSLFDFVLTFGGSGAVILYNYLVPDTSFGYKLSLTGIILFITVLFVAKAMFEKSYREKLDTMLQQLAEATDADVKTVISEDIRKHKVKQSVYERLMLLMPLIVLVFVATIAIQWLEDLRASAGLILASMSGGSVFNVLKKPQKDKVEMQKYKNRAKK